MPSSYGISLGLSQNISQKIQNGQHKQRSDQHTLARQKNIPKNLSKVSPMPRINKDLQSESGLLKRKAPADTHNSSSSSSSNGPPVRKVRPSNAENEADIQTLEKEIRALHWLARRKEQEWDQVRSRSNSTGSTVLPGKTRHRSVLL